MEIGNQWCCRQGHHMNNCVEDLGDEFEVNCIACEKEIKGFAYTCNNCRLALHKECAESFGRSVLRKPCPNTFRPWLPKTYACTACKQDQKPFSETASLASSKPI